MKIKLNYKGSYIKYTTGLTENYELDNGVKVNGVYTNIDEIYVPDNLKFQRVEYKLLNEAMKRIFDEGDLTIKYFAKGLRKDTEEFDYLYSILTDFSFHVISKTDQGVMFGFLTKEQLDE